MHAQTIGRMPVVFCHPLEPVDPGEQPAPQADTLAAQLGKPQPDRQNSAAAR